MSLEFSQFNALVDHLIAQGYDEETAADYVARVGDIPELDDDGNVVVRDDARQIIARLKDYPLGSG